MQLFCLPAVVVEQDVQTRYFHILTEELEEIILSLTGHELEYC